MGPASFLLAAFCFQVHPTLLAAACDGHCVIIPAAHNYRTYLRSHSHTLTNLHAHPFACVSRALFFSQSCCSAVPRRSKRWYFKPKVELGYGKVPENTVSVDACILCLFSRSIFFVFEAFSCHASRAMSRRLPSYLRCVRLPSTPSCSTFAMFSPFVACPCGSHSVSVHPNRYHHQKEPYWRTLPLFACLAVQYN